MPYTVERKSENGFDKIILKNTSTNILAEIIPSCGAILHAFTIWQNHHFINVIEQYDSAADFAAHVESKGMRSCKLSPFACRLKNGRYRFNEQEYKVDKYTLGEHAIHGLIYDAVFEVTKMEADKEKAIVELLYSYPGDNAGYPFKYDCTVRYTLKEGNALEISTEIVNKDNNAIPMQDGWHPYFRTGSKREDLELENLIR
jgi:aldose 1-epimerase